MTLVRSGKTSEIIRSCGTWAFVDVGFSHKSRTAALLVDDGTPELFTFSQLRRAVTELATRQGPALNLVIEAPLSAAFTREGNPAGRRMEKGETGQRYWYMGAGCQVALAAAYLLRAVIDARPKREVRIFEAFVSFKAKGGRSDHAADVCAMRDVVWNENRTMDAVLSPESLPGKGAEYVESTFAVFGFDLGVPPVIIANAT